MGTPFKREKFENAFQALNHHWTIKRDIRSRDGQKFQIQFRDDRLNPLGSICDAKPFAPKADVSFDTLKKEA